MFDGIDRIDIHTYNVHEHIELKIYMNGSSSMANRIEIYKFIYLCNMNIN